MTGRTLLVAVVGVGIILPFGSIPQASADPRMEDHLGVSDPVHGANPPFGDTEVTMDGNEATVAGQSRSPGSRPAESPGGVKYHRLGKPERCVQTQLLPGAEPVGWDSCAVLHTCPAGQVWVGPLFRDVLDPATGAVVSSELVDPRTCVSPTKDLAAAVGQEFARLPLAGSTITIQPPGGNTLVNLDTIVFTDGATQDLTATVLGTPVTIRAYPVRYSWDFGDAKEPLVTTDVGHPYPDQTLTRPYDHAGTYTITLTTTWRGEYRTTGTTDWLPVTGAATTVTTAPPLTAHEAHSHLVDTPLP